MLGLGRGAALGLAAVALALAGCGDDTNGEGGTVGERYAASVENLTDAACACFGDLGYPSEGACIDGIGLGGSMQRMCIGSAVDAVSGTERRYECLLEANGTAEACIRSGGCAGAAECGTAFDAEVGRCPELADPVRTEFNAARRECLGDEVMPGTCPEVTSNAGFGGAISGTTIGFADDYSFPGDENCGALGTGAPDVTVVWTAPADGRYLFSLNADNTDFRAAMIAINGCDDLTAQVCIDNNRDGIRVDPATAGGTVTFIIDGLSSIESGNFQIDVSEAPPM